jgi:L-lactate dehydrogenase complex protein LldF
MSRRAGEPRGSTFLGLPRAVNIEHLHGQPFPVAARAAVADTQLRRNLGNATATIRAKRARVVGEVPDWAALRSAGAAIKDSVLANLDELLVQLESEVTRRGGTVHWARDAVEANAIVTSLVRATGADEVVKVKSMATQEIGLNEALEAAGIAAWETDLAELIVQLGHDKPSHILVPAIHRNRAEIREIFLREMAGVGLPAPADLTDSPPALAEAARRHLRQKFLDARVAISGANFAVASTGTLSVVESEGNGRMCITLPRTLITVMGIEKLVPTWADLEVFLQLLPRSSTGERMNPYTSMWSGAVEGQEFHLVLLDNGRTAVLGDPSGRAALRCIRCSACLNVCPVYERTGGHAYGSVYPGPIGAVLSPQLTGVAENPTLPYASSLCGACYDACPVAIDIPTMLVHLRSQVPHPVAERAVMRSVAYAMGSPRRWAAALSAFRAGRLLGGRRGRIRALPPPLSGWTASRDLPVPPAEGFRDWWTRTHGSATTAPERRRPAEAAGRGHAGPGAAGPGAAGPGAAGPGAGGPGAGGPGAGGPGAAGPGRGGPAVGGSGVGGPAAPAEGGGPGGAGPDAAGAAGRSGGE